MTWGRVKSVAVRAVMAVLSRDHSASANRKATDGPATTTSPKSKSNGPQSLADLLTARALTLHNRNRKAAQRYLDTHQSLASQVYSEKGTL